VRCGDRHRAKLAHDGVDGTRAARGAPSRAHAERDRQRGFEDHARKQEREAELHSRNGGHQEPFLDRHRERAAAPE
jgi:hypothetical protein